VVGSRHANLIARLPEVSLAPIGQSFGIQIIEHRLRPNGVRQLGAKKPRRPTAPKDRASTEAIGKPGERNASIPGKTPNFTLQQMIYSSACGVQAERRQILLVLGQQEWPSVKHQDAFAAPCGAEPKMFGDSRAERAAADNDEVEGTEVTAG